MSRKLVCLMGLLLVFAGTAQGAYGTYYGDRDDRYYNDPYYPGDRYRDELIVRCESRDRRTVYCVVDTRGGVRLVDQHSDRRCIRGQTWGTYSRGIWVSGGCRASFEVNTRGRRDDRYGRTVRCESWDSRTVYCALPTRGGVYLAAQLSRSPCIEGRTWGISRNGVWVTRGCRAEFRVGSRERRYGDDDWYDDY